MPIALAVLLLVILGVLLVLGLAFVMSRPWKLSKDDAMSLALAIILGAILDAAILGGLAFVMSRPRRLLPHEAASDRLLALVSERSEESTSDALRRPRPRPGLSSSRSHGRSLTRQEAIAHAECG